VAWVEAWRAVIPPGLLARRASARLGQALPLALCMIVALASPVCSAATRAPRVTAADSASETVYFPSADGKTELVGYIFAPAGAAPHAAVVMLHGRAGPYSSTVNKACSTVARAERSPCNAQTLSRRHVMWGRFWAERGYLALHVDSFGPRGKAAGFGRHTHDSSERDDVNERSVRPLDAIGALRYLRSRPDVQAERIALQGWSNGGSTVLNALADSADMRAAWGGGPGFVAAVAFYPGCGSAAVPMRRYETRVPLMVFLGDADEEVSADVCARLLAGVTGGAGGSTVGFKRYAGAAHDFDDPGHQSDPANAAARQDAVAEAEAFFRARLAR